MIKNYLTVAWRTLRRRPGFSTLNVVGLAVGLAAVLLIGLWVQDELSYDDFHENADRTYRVLREFDIPDLHGTIDGTPAALAPALEERVPAVERAVRTQNATPTVQRGTQTFVEDDFLWVDKDFFEVFSFPLKHGEAALGRPGTVVLTKGMVAKYFSNEDPVGKTLQVGDRTLEVTGVMHDVPSNSSLEFDFVGSLKTRAPEREWSPNSYVTYVMLEKSASKSEVLPLIDEVITVNTKPESEREAGVMGGGDIFIPHLQPLTGIHLGTGVPVEIGSAGNPLYVWLFAALAGFVLLLACINFTNLATARSAERAREVGMRKALGAQREQLAGQFLGEALLLSAAATVLAVALARLGVPLMNALSGKEMALGPMLASPWVLALPALALVVGLVAGAFPAFALSRFEPVEVLRGTFTNGHGGRRFRQGLVVFQFVVSIALVASTGVVYQQLRFMRSAGLGFNEENVVIIERAGKLGEQRDAFLQEVRKLPGVKRAASSLSVPGTFFLNSMWASTEPGAEPRNMDYSYVGDAYTETLGIEMAAGQDFGPATPDTLAVMLNETAAQKYGWTPQEAVGKGIQRGPYEAEVVGVMKDFHYEPLSEEIYSMMLFPDVQRQNRVAVRLTGEDVPSALASLRSTWEQFSDLPLNYSFLANDLAAEYRAEDRMAKVFATGALLAVLVACLGLLGLAAFTAERRTKEVGIRKAMGASVTSIVGLLSKDFLKLVGVGFALAVPGTYLAMQRWLEGFAYRIELGPWVFLAAGLLALLVAVASVSTQALRAAWTDPATAIRQE